MARHLLTEYQVIALRAALAVKGSQTERIAAGIDACRSPVYHQAMAAHRTEVTIRRAAGEGISDLVAPAAERVPGGPDLRLWLRSELDRIAKIRCAKAGLSIVPAFPFGSVWIRAAASVRRAVYTAYTRCTYRQSESRWAGGEHSVCVDIIPAGYEEYVKSETERVWSSNGKWSGTNSSHMLGVALRWRLDVERRGLAELDGLLTLAASPLPHLQSGEEAYAIAYVRQGRGTAIEVGRAVAYRRDGGAWKRAASLSSARRGTVRATATCSPEARA